MVRVAGSKNVRVGTANMKKVRITVMKQTVYQDLIDKYENPIEHACDMVVGQVLLLMVGKSLKVCVTVPGRACLPLL